MTLTLQNGERYGRHPTIPVLATSDHLAYLYALGTRDNGFNAPVRTDVFWKGRWLLVVNQIESFEPVQAAHGAFALGLESLEAGTWHTDEEMRLVAVENGERKSLIQGLVGFDRTLVDTRSEDEPRQHLNSPEHITPIVQGPWREGKQVYAALIWSGEVDEPVDAWEVREGEKGRWRLWHAQEGTWDLEHAILPQLIHE